MAAEAPGVRHSNYPGYEFRWKGGRRVPDEYERAVMGRIVEWKSKGYTWDEIYFHLLRHRVRTKHGGEASERVGSEASG